MIIAVNTYQEKPKEWLKNYFGISPLSPLKKTTYDMPTPRSGAVQLEYGS